MWVHFKVFIQCVLISIHLFFHSLDSRLRLLLIFVNVLLVVDFGESSARVIRRVWPSGPAPGDFRLGWFRDESGGAVLLLLLLLRVGYLKIPESIVVTLVWTFAPAREAVQLTPVGVEGATMALSHGNMAPAHGNMARRAPFPPRSIPDYITSSFTKSLLIYIVPLYPCQ
jgi:hypothetical protein